eukprot:GAHX01004537.1.p1 GENE.GAHX01004537.1~~GAHX01004537.1.p1  ORF type:complete len:60 (-),score=3.94 GAHX01004537.1:495-674(-)
MEDTELTVICYGNNTRAKFMFTLVQYNSKMYNGKTSFSSSISFGTLIKSYLSLLHLFWV